MNTLEDSSPKSGHQILFTLFLATLAALPPLATDLYLSTLSVIGHALDVTPEAAGYTVSVFLASFAAAQLFFGPLSDRMGRRPVGLFGCALFALGGFGCMLSSSLSILLLWRALEGVGAGSATVLAFAIVRDRFEGNHARVMISYVSATQALAPMIAPVFGSLLFKVAGWRMLFAFLGSAGILLLLIFLFGFRESLPIEQRAAAGLTELRKSFQRIFGSRSVLGYCLLNAFMLASLLAFITGSSFLFVDLLGMGRTTYGWLLFLIACGSMIGSWLSGLLGTARVGHGRILAAGLALALLATCGLLILSLAGCFNVATALPLTILLTIAVGLTIPNAAHGALAPLQDVAGTAAAVFGCMGTLGGAISAAVVASMPHISPLTLSAIMAGFSVLAVLDALLLARPKL
ncbi:multidrug effflux MFS transporter [Telmatobacter bradus]|uniref:multidrug effflux MFS transporter n=1 Tax=Telmatobacter bradus TaxID=474953 RepID=UPI003B43CFDA